MKHGQIHAKLFLEGIEVPFVGATITSSINQASIAYIDVVPHAAINNIKPRTMVQIACLDYRSEKYATAFEGEVFGFNFNKSPTSRSVTLQCIDFSSYWDNVLTYFFNAQQGLAGGADFLSRAAEDMKAGDASAVKSQTVSYSQESYYKQIIQNTPGDFLDGVVEVIKRISEVNEFYKLADERLKIKDRIFLKSSGELLKLIEKSEAEKWFTGITGGYSGFSTLRTVINDLMSLIFHDSISPAFPSRINGKVAQFLFKPNMFMIPPPMCNVFYPDEYSSFTYNRNFFQEPTRMSYKPEMPMYAGGGRVALGNAFAPKSFDYFMFKDSKDADIGKGALQAPRDYGHYNDSDPGRKITNDKKKEGQFLTNEELMKGILLANETMMPSSTQFTSGLEANHKKALAQKIANYLFFKKRFQKRECQITSHLKASVVPGFTVLIVDDSEADQNIIAYCNSVTHRIYSTQGGYTNCNLSYARTVVEQEQTSTNIGEPLIPPWFSKEIFGQTAGPNMDSMVQVETYGQVSAVQEAFNYTPGQSSNLTDELNNIQEKITSNEGDGPIPTSTKMPSTATATSVGGKLSQFYASLLGSLASQSITGYSRTDNTAVAAAKIVNEYKNAKKKKSVDALIKKATTRDYASITDSFAFIGASCSTKDMTKKNLEFRGNRMSGIGFADKPQIDARRLIVTQYRDALRDHKAFKG